MDNRIFEEQYGNSQSAGYLQPPVWVRFLEKYSKHRIQVVSELLPDGKLSVLEIGCGDGTFLYENKNHWKEIVGVDIVSSVLAKAKKRKYGCPAHFMKKDFGRKAMPFDKNHFDICVSIATMQYVHDIDLLFAEVHRVLRKNGLWIFQVNNIAVFWRRIEFLFGRVPKTSHYTNAWDAGVVHYFTYADLMDFCRKKSFRVESVGSSGIMSSIRSLWPGMLGADLIFTCRKR